MEKVSHFPPGGRLGGLGERFKAHTFELCFRSGKVIGVKSQMVEAAAFFSDKAAHGRISAKRKEDFQGGAAALEKVNLDALGRDFFAVKGCETKSGLPAVEGTLIRQGDCDMV